MAHPTLRRLPVRARRTVAYVPDFVPIYSSGGCDGFSPSSHHLKAGFRGLMFLQRTKLYFTTEDTEFTENVDIFSWLCVLRDLRGETNALSS